MDKPKWIPVTQVSLQEATRSHGVIVLATRVNKEMRDVRLAHHNGCGCWNDARGMPMDNETLDKVTHWISISQKKKKE